MEAEEEVEEMEAEEEVEECEEWATQDEENVIKAEAMEEEFGVMNSKMNHMMILNS